LGNAQTKQKRSVGDFSGISSATGIHVEISQGNENAVVVMASDDAYIDRMKTEVDNNGVLKIFMENTNRKGWNNKYRVKLYAYITYKSIDKLMASSGASLQAINTVKAPTLKIDVSSGASLEATIQTTESELTMSSGAVAKLKGTSESIRINASSGSNLKAIDLNTALCTVLATSGAEIKLAVRNKIFATASSGASIKYKGNPSIEQKSMNSGGELKSINN
jgi:hypothetical protein